MVIIGEIYVLVEADDSPTVNMLSEDLEGMSMWIRSRTTQMIFQNYFFN